MPAPSKSLGGRGNIELWLRRPDRRPCAQPGQTGRCSKIRVHRSHTQDCTPMAAELKTSLVSSIEAAAAQAGLVLLSVSQSTASNGRGTAVFQFGLPDAVAPGKALKLELTEGFNF